MPTAVAAVTTATLPTPATAPATAAKAPTDPFAAIFGAAVADSGPTSPADAVGAAGDLAADDLVADVLADPRAIDQNAVALAAAGVLVIVPGITPAAPQATPTVDPDAAAVGVTTATSDDLPALTADTQSRAEQLRFQLAAGLQNPTPLTQQPGEQALPVRQPAAPPAPPAVPEQPRLTHDTPAVATPANPLPTGVPAAQTPTIPAQAPIVTGVVIPPVAPAPLTPPDTTVEATPAVAGLPGVPAGDRPSVAGERFVALANTGAGLAEPAPTAVPTAAPTVPFADVARDAGVTSPAPAPVAPAPTPVPSAPTTVPPAVTAAPTITAAPTTVPPAVTAVPTTVTPAVTPPAEPVVPAPPAEPRPVTAPVTAFPNVPDTSRPAVSADQFVAPVAGVVTESSAGRVTRPRADVLDLPRDADPRTLRDAAAAPPVTAPVALQTTDAPPAVARAAPTTPVAVQLTDGVVAHARHLAATGEVEFRMRLDPPDLGQVRVHLVGSGEHVRGEVVVADDAVRRMIESQLPELRQRLEAAGVTIQRFDVTTDANAGGAGANPNGGSADRTPTDVPPATPAAARPTRPWYTTPLPSSGLDVTV